MENKIQETLEYLLKMLSTPFRKIRMEKKDDKTFRANIESEEPSLLIGYHGENISALQTILKILVWKKYQTECNIIVDVDDYHKRQEENVIKLAERKVETLKQTGASQSLPPMSPYFRRIVHLHLTEKFTDVETESMGEGDFRHIVVKLKS